MVQEINFLLEYTRTAKTADFKNSTNPHIPIQSADNINAPPFFSYCNYMNKKNKSAWT